MREYRRIDPVDAKRLLDFANGQEVRIGELETERQELITEREAAKREAHEAKVELGKLRRKHGGEQAERATGVSDRAT